MKSIKLSLVAAILASTAVVSNVSAEEVEVSANVAMTSNYVWRGMTQTDNSAAIQGGVDAGYMGAYAGVWGSNISWTNQNDSSLEADLYAGYANEISGVSYDVGFVAYTYANADAANNFGEAYLGLGYDFGVASIGASYALGVSIADADDIPDNWEVSASAPLPMDYSVDAVYGDYDTVGSYYLVGLNKSFGKFDFTVAYTANDGTDEDNFVLSAATSF